MYIRDGYFHQAADIRKAMVVKKVFFYDAFSKSKFGYFCHP
jgi:hypothetical protein